MIDEKTKKTIEKSEIKLNEDILKLFEFDKYDEIVISKKDFKIKLSMVKMMIMTTQMKGFGEHMKNLKIFQKSTNFIFVYD